jgi:hypothetical protein
MEGVVIYRKSGKDATTWIEFHFPAETFKTFIIQTRVFLGNAGIVQQFSAILRMVC